MNEYLRKYIGELIDGIPIYVYVGLLSILVVGVVLIYTIKRESLSRYVSLLFLIEYILLIFSSTVFFRVPNGMETTCFRPFWSYDNPHLFVQNIMNVLVFVPLGPLMGWAIKSIKWWQVLFTGSFISFTIELLQLLSKLGYAEVDDIIHNSLGCVIGYGVFLLARYIYESFSKKHLCFL